MSLCLFLVEDWPITPNAVGGAPALTHSHLQLLAYSENEIALVVISSPNNPMGFEDFRSDQPDVWDGIERWCNTTRIFQLHPVHRKATSLRRSLLALHDPAVFLYRDLMTEDGIGALRNLISKVKPDVIWAEHLIPASLAQRAARDIPVIYSHHDWKWRIKRHRAGERANEWKRRFRFWLSKCHEEGLVRKVAGCVSASITEAVEILALGANQVGYFPTTYTPIDLPPGPTPCATPRIVHLGGMQTTANRIGLQRFLKIAWPFICENLKAIPELWVIGSLEGAPPALLTDLERAGAICTGFVKDLRSVLRAYDFHIIPWEYNTGTRTRIPLILNHAQVLVSTRMAASSISELKRNENSILAEDLPQMALEIVKLFYDDSARQRIGQAGRMTFLNHFTREAIQPRFNDFMNLFL